MSARPSLALALLALLAACSTLLLAGAHPHSSDCMRNPFASGCRGISAKRSAGQPVAMPDGAAELYRLLEPGAGQLQQAQLTAAVELLVEAANRLAALGQLEQRQLTGARQLCHNLGSLDGGELLASDLLFRRGPAPLVTSRGNREEAA